MAVSRIGNIYNNVYRNTYSLQKDEMVKERGTENTSYTEQAANKTVNDNVSDYYSYLQKNYECVKNGNVVISGTYLKECAKNPEKAKELEESLSFFKEGYQNGLRSAQANAMAIGAKLVGYSESWSIDSTGNITMMASTTVTSGSSIKGWKELAEEREEKLKEKKEQECTSEKIKEQKEQEKQLLEKMRMQALPAHVIKDAYHKPVDIKA